MRLHLSLNRIKWSYIELPIKLTRILDLHETWLVVNDLFDYINMLCPAQRRMCFLGPLFILPVYPLV